MKLLEVNGRAVPVDRIKEIYMESEASKEIYMESEASHPGVIKHWVKARLDNGDVWFLTPDLSCEEMADRVFRDILRRLGGFIFVRFTREEDALGEGKGDDSVFCPVENGG